MSLTARDLAVIATLDLSAAEAAVLMTLCGHANGSGVAWPSWPRIAAEAHCARATVATAVQVLSARGYIVKAAPAKRGRPTRWLVPLKLAGSTPVEVRELDPNAVTLGSSSRQLGSSSRTKPVQLPDPKKYEEEEKGAAPPSPSSGTTTPPPLDD